MTAGLLDLGDPRTGAAALRYQQLQGQGMPHDQILAMLQQEGGMPPVAQLAMQYQRLKNASAQQQPPAPQGTIAQQLQSGQLPPAPGQQAPAPPPPQQRPPMPQQGNPQMPPQQMPQRSPMPQQQGRTAGIAGLPAPGIGKNFASGGIIAFDEGGDIQNSMAQQTQQDYIAQARQAALMQQQRQQAQQIAQKNSQGTPETTFSAKHGGHVPHFADGALISTGGGDVPTPYSDATPDGSAPINRTYSGPYKGKMPSTQLQKRIAQAAMYQAKYGGGLGALPESVYSPQGAAYYGGQMYAEGGKVKKFAAGDPVSGRGNLTGIDESIPDADYVAPQEAPVNAELSERQAARLRGLPSADAEVKARYIAERARQARAAAQGATGAAETAAPTVEAAGAGAGETAAGLGGLGKVAKGIFGPIGFGVQSLLTPTDTATQSQEDLLIPGRTAALANIHVGKPVNAPPAPPAAPKANLPPKDDAGISTGVNGKLRGFGVPVPDISETPAPKQQSLAEMYAELHGMRGPNQGLEDYKSSLTDMAKQLQSNTDYERRMAMAKAGFAMAAAASRPGQAGSGLSKFLSAGAQGGESLATDLPKIQQAQQAMQQKLIEDKYKVADAVRREDSEDIKDSVKEFNARLRDATLLAGQANQAGIQARHDTERFNATLAMQGRQLNLQNKANDTAEFRNYHELLTSLQNQWKVNETNANTLVMSPEAKAAHEQNQAELATKIKGMQNWLSSRVPGLAAQSAQSTQLPYGDAVAAEIKRRQAGG